MTRPGENILLFLVVLACLAPAIAVGRIGWMQGSWAWGAFAALGPAALLVELFGMDVLKRVEARLPPAARRGFYFAGCVLTTAVAVGVATATRDRTLLFVAPVLGIAVGLALAFALRRVADLDAWDERLHFTPNDLPFLMIVVYSSVWCFHWLWGEVSARSPDGVRAAFAILKAMAMLCAAALSIAGAVWLLRFLLQHLRQPLIWIGRFVLFVIMVGIPLLGITVGLASAERLPWYLAADAVAMVVAFALLARRELRREAQARPDRDPSGLPGPE